ncbi:MAG: carboxyltransferase domain-containing protein [Rhodobacter sp.]|nr:carboxyltransferase domain-containing protein [Rhodobacter sp.]
MTEVERWPRIRDIGLAGKLVSFGDTLSDSANRAALAFRAAVEAERWEGIEETATTLVSVYLRYDPLRLGDDALDERLAALLDGKDWRAMPLPRGRTLWRIPAVLGGPSGPQFIEAASCAGVDAAQARRDVTEARLRVLTVGFAPGQPYIGELPERWNIARMTRLNPQVPGGSLVVSIRQLIIFSGPTPTGWRHIGKTAFDCFRPEAERPFPLSSGDEVTFREVTGEELDYIRATDLSGNGGATREKMK